MKDNDNELFPCVDEAGNVIGTILRSHAHNGSKVLHPVVHLHVFNSQGQLYLQKRPAWKTVQPNKWDTACGGHVDAGETIEQALLREVREELGMTAYQPLFLTKYVYDSETEKELVYVFKTIYDGEINPHETELNGGRFFSQTELMNSMGKGILTPNFEEEYRQIFIK